MAHEPKAMAKTGVGGAAADRRTPQPAVYTPRTDIYETGDAIVVVADMPGVNKESLEITLEENILTIDGRVDQDETEGLRQTHREFTVGDYHRTFTLSDAVSREGIEARVKDGVLRLTLPKHGPTRARKIPVQGE
ncbi:MAG: Hsp20/alpha crystallin family protein [Nitrospirota bacterium]|jgi:HSP20 family molecular chaperone IbpA